MQLVQTGPGSDTHGRRTALFLAVLGVALALPAAPRAACPGQLLVTTKDSWGQPLVCRVVSRNSSGNPLYPDSTEVCYPHSGGIPYFVSDGSFLLEAAGPVALTFSKGPEFRSQQRTMVVDGSDSLHVVMERRTDMNLLGWHSADTHAHLSHGEPNPLEPEDGVRMARAEGLEFIAILDGDRYFLGAPDPASTPDCMLYSSLEYRSGVYGHIAFPGLGSLIHPFGSAGPGEPAYPMNASMIQQAKAGSGVAVYAHPLSHYNFWDTSDWPATGIAREIAADAALGQIDAMEVLSYSNHQPLVAFSLWYDLLNAGAHVAAAAGTDAVLNRAYSLPAGGYRVYACTREAEFDLEDWLDALRSQRTFVTGGPLITGFTAGSAEIGDTLRLPAGSQSVQGELSAVSDARVYSAEILWNGVTVHCATFPLADSIAVEYSVTVKESGWLAARVTGIGRPDVHVVADPIAHTSPIWIEVGGEPMRPQAAPVRRLVDWNEDLLTLVRGRGGFGSPSDSLEVEERLAQGRLALGAPFASPPGSFSLLDPVPGALVRETMPALSWQAAVDADAGDLVEYGVRIAPAPELVAGSPANLAENTFYSVEDPLEHGLTYYWTVEALDAARNGTLSEMGWFTVDTTGTTAVPPPPAMRVPWRASPAPFSASVTFTAPDAGPARLDIFDLSGRCVRTLEGMMPLHWDGRDNRGRDVPSGVYIARPQDGPSCRLVRIR